MGDFNVDLSSVEQAQELVAQKEANEVVSSDDDDEESTGSKVFFYIIMGILGICGVGVPILIWFLVKSRKKNKQLQKELDEMAAGKKEEKPADKEAAEEKKETQEEKEKTPEK